MKNFDEWNTNKKTLDTESNRHFYHEREIWWCKLGLNVGFEQDGTSMGFQRPVLILKAWSRETCLILPLTTSNRKSKYKIGIGYVTGNPNKESKVILSQIRLIDTKRLTEKIIWLKKEKFLQIKKAVKDLL